MVAPGDENTFLASVQIVVISAHSGRQFRDKMSAQIKVNTLFNTRDEVVDFL